MFTIPQKSSIRLFARSLALTGLLLIGSVSASAGDRAFSFGIAGGVHGGSLNHFKDTPEGVADPIKPGLIGIHYGYQFGVDLQVSILWIKAMYLASNYWITDWAADPTGQTDRRYANNTIFTPVLFKLKETATAAGAVGVFYSLPLTSSDFRDWGLALAFRTQAGSPKLFADLLMTGGFLKQGFGAQAINFQFGLGYKL